MKALVKFLLFLILIPSILFALVYFGSDPFLKKIINKKASENKIAGIYNIQVTHAHINVWNMGISLRGIVISADSNANTLKLFPYHKNIISADINGIHIASIDLLKWYKNKELDISRITLSGAHIKLIKNPHYKSPLSGSSQESADSYPIIKHLNLGLLKVKNLSLEYYLYDKKNPDLSIGALDLEIDQPQIDLIQLHKIDKASILKKTKLNIKNIVFRDKKDFYQISLTELYTQDPSTHITLEKLQIEPLLSKQEFAKKHPFQTDRFDGIIETIRVSSLDINQLINENLIAIEKILVSDLQMEIFRDKNQAFNFKNFPKFPQQSLKSLKQKIEIGEIEFSNTDIIYLEKPIDGTQIGRISITNIQAKVKNLGNSKEWQKSKTVNLTLEAKLYNKAPLFAQLNFPLRTNTFHFSGHLGKTKMNIFNHMSIANSGIKIKDGILKEMTFNIKADLNASRGRLKLIYQDLEISLLKESNQEGKRIIKERKFFNFLANKVILPTENPDEDGDLYYATIAFERNKNKGIFNYLWKSIFSGMKDTFSKGHKIESIQMQIEEGKEADLSKKDQRRLARDKKKKKAESQ